MPKQKTIKGYKGFNKDPKAKGRYASKHTDSQGYCGVELFKAIPFTEMLEIDMKAIEEEAYAEDE